MSNVPPSDFLTDLAHRQIQLNPRKFGILGSYSRELLRAEASEDYVWAMDQVALRLTTSVLSGRTINKDPEVVLNLPASWWQHFKHQADWWISNKHARFNGSEGTPAPWLVFLWPLFVLFPKFIRKRPIRYTTVTSQVHFEQDVLYPEVDMQMPAHLGRPVIYETINVSYPSVIPPFGSNLNSGPSRFLSQHEVMSEMQRDPEFTAQTYRYPMSPNPYAVLQWLERRGVNVDQLVKRR